MKKAKVNKFCPLSAEYVIAHALWQKSRGRRPSVSYRGEKNPLKALILAKETSEIYQEKAVLAHLGANYCFERRGAIKYIVQRGVRIGGGYHGYFLKKGAVYGEYGATREIVISANGEINNKGGFDRHHRTRCIH